MRATPEEAARASLHRVFGSGPWPDSATALDQDPAGSLREIAAEYAEFYARLIAPHWERIRSVLEADITYRTGALARGGVRALFGDMHPELTWAPAGVQLTRSANTADTAMSAFAENRFSCLGYVRAFLIVSPDHSIDLLIHVVGYVNHLGVALVGALREDHVDELGDDIDV